MLKKSFTRYFFIPDEHRLENQSPQKVIKLKVKIPPWTIAWDLCVRAQRRKKIPLLIRSRAGVFIVAIFISFL